MIELNQKYDREHLLSFLKDAFLNDFQKDIRPVGSGSLSAINKAYTLGSSPSLDLQVFEFEYSGSFNKRIALAKEAFQVMKQSATFQALAVFYSPDIDDWRFSLMTANPQRNDKGNISVAYSNPRRYSFFLGPNAKVNTPTKFLVKKGKVVDFDDLKSRFSLEVVNKEFYKEISKSYTKLVGGAWGEGKEKENYEPVLKLPSVNDHSQASIEFAVRLIGRIIFCWFLREKVSKSGSPLMPKRLFSLDAISSNVNYYHQILEPIFFEILNKPVKSRINTYSSEPFSLIPYLNGGLFSPHDHDFFSYNERKRDQYFNTVVIPDEWFRDFFGILETYNFTIDENTSIDEELSIDPEMLGRIFENLLAEINPETGESARKSTGSYYTPRVIVDYMVDESLLLYLKQKTSINEKKLRAIISYDLSDDSSYPLDDGEKKELVDAIEKAKILDPACGSGAFPIGALQKIVFILQQADPDGHYWFQKQIQHTSPEIKKVIEREFSHKNFDYIRKIGIIRENIYGIDIQPIAIEISKLRCFLTLVVDERIDDSNENRGIEPLPNLDFKFVIANSLIGLPSSNNKNQLGLFEDSAGISELREIRDMFFNASGSEREQLKLQFVQAQNKMFQRLISENRRGHADLTTLLSTWDPFNHSASSWFDPEWMFGLKDGFDIIIANPPYDVYEGHRDEEIKIIRSNHVYDIAGGGKLNAYKLFLAKSVTLQKKNGILCEIFQNSFLGDNSAKLLRKYFLESQQIIQIDSFPERDNHKKRVFPGVKMSVCVLLSLKMTKTDNNFILNVWSDRYMSNGYKTIFSCREILHSSPNEFVIPMISESEKLPYFRLTTITSKFESIAKCFRGELNMTTERKYFTTQPNEYMALKGAQIQRYFITNDPSQGTIEYVLKNKYQKEKKGMKSQHFQFERIVFQRITGVNENIRLKAALLNAGSFCADSCNYLIPQNGVSLYFLLALLNSSLINWLFRKTSTNSNVNGYEIDSLPVVVNSIFINPISELVEKILEITSSNAYLEKSSKNDEFNNYNKQIDKMIYELYGLTDKEIKIVEGETTNENN